MVLGFLGKELGYELNLFLKNSKGVGKAFLTFKFKDSQRAIICIKKKTIYKYICFSKYNTLLLFIADTDWH